MTSRWLNHLLIPLLVLAFACDKPGDNGEKDLLDKDATHNGDIGDVASLPDEASWDQNSDAADQSEQDAADIPADTGMDVGPVCPAASPGPGDECEGSMVCRYGQECCCGECYDSLVCQCAGGSFACYATDACLRPGCEDFPCCRVGEDWECQNLIPGGVCVPMGPEGMGKCMVPAPDPFCWHDGDCDDGKTCREAAVCPCDAACDMEDAPGWCLPASLPTGCCTEDDHCDRGTGMAWTCAFLPEHGEGECKTLPPQGKCWDNGDCPDGKRCHGATFCPCSTPCGMPEGMGDCIDAVLGDVGDPCGPDGGDCLPELVCCYPCGIPPPGCQFQCTYPCDEEEPWCSAGCGMYP
jgi:hypothetical protein